MNFFERLIARFQEEQRREAHVEPRVDLGFDGKARQRRRRRNKAARASRKRNRSR